ncbi:MAG: DUF1634 domain-containing protein [Thermoplasmatales archaeon]|nr:DUF1634 domain-containing protein [Thermoplasmatales archaeon]MCW6169597.1 DUF1634 domain-containing protein [Thermoplasmatales archaeon]
MKSFDDTMVVSHFLRGGSILSVIFILSGVILLFVKREGDGFTLQQIASYSYSLGHGIDSKNIPTSDIIQGVLRLDGIYFIALGLWLLIFTSISVVVVRLVWFATNKDKKFVIITLVVLFNLFFAMLIVPSLL